MADVSSMLQAAISGGVQAQPAPVAVPVPVTQQKMADVAAVTPQNMADVAATADAKKAELSGGLTADTFHNAAMMRLTGVGSASASPLEHDIAFMSPEEKAVKYGQAQADSFDAATDAAANLFSNQRNATRSYGQVAGDAIKGAVEGAITAPVQIGALGLGLLNHNAGVAAAQASKALSDAVEGSESNGLGANRDADQQLSTLSNRDEDQQYANDQASGAPLPWLQHMGREAISAAKNTLSNPVLLGDQAAQGLGSLVSMGPLADGAGLATKIAAPLTSRIGVQAALDAAAGTPSLARAAVAAAPSDMMLAGGAMGAGGSYTGTTNDAYNTLIQQGVDPDQAAAQANKAGLISAAVAGPLATATSHLSEGFMENPFVTNSVGHTASNLIRQTVEQGAMGAEGQFGQNVGIKAEVDPNQDLSQGVGAAAGEGALSGLTAASLTQAPGLIGHLPGAALDAVSSRGAKTQADNAAASSSSPENIAKASADFSQTAAAPQTKAAFDDAAGLAKTNDEAQASTNPPGSDSTSPAIDGTSTSSSSSTDAMEALGQKIQDYGKFNPIDITKNIALSDDVKQAVSQAPDRASATLALANEVATKGADTPQGLAAATEMNNQLEGFEKIVTSNHAAFAAIPDDHPSIGVINQFNDLADRIDQNPSVLAARQKVQGLTDEQVSSLITPVTEESLDEPAGKQNVQNALMVASQAPAKLPLETADQISQMVANGKLKLTQEQFTALKTATAVVSAAKTATDTQSKQGNAPLDNVSKNVLTDEVKNPSGKNSLTYYAKGVYTGMRSGNLDYAQGHMTDLANLVQHQQNKLTALNTHYEQGPKSESVSFQAWNPEKKAPYATKGDNRATVHPDEPGSIAFAQRVAGETQRLTDTYNNLSKAFPELKAGSFDHVELHPDLNQRKVTTKEKTNYAVDRRTLDTSDISSTDRVDRTDDRVPTQPKAQSEGMESKVTAEEPPVVQPTATPSADNTGSSGKVVEEKPAPKSIKEAFPNLVHTEDGAKGTNRFHEAYQLNQGTSRIAGDSIPVRTILKALRSNETLTNHLDGTARNVPLMDKVAAGTRELIKSAVPALREKLDNNLKDFLAKTTKKGVSNAEALEAGKANDWRNGSILNLVEKQKDGSYKYNDSLVNSALLAGVQWLQTYNETSRAPDSKAIEAMTDIPEDKQAPGIEHLFNGVDQTSAVKSLASKIIDYWGVKKNDDAFKSFTDGIANSMASEVLEAFKNTGVPGILGDDGPFLRSDELTFTHEDGVPVPEGKTTSTRTLNRLVRNLDVRDGDGSINILFQDPHVIDDAVLSDRPNRDYYGTDKIKVAETQLHNPTVDLTRPQRSMVGKAQEVEHLLNLPIYKLYGDLGLNDLKTAFGGGNVDERVAKGTINVNEAAKLRGQNQTVESAWNTLQARVTRMQLMEGNLHEIPIKYAFEVAGNGRLMMQGAQNPQLSKLVREVVLPTWGNVNLKNQDEKNLFMTAIAQAVGIKIHRYDTDTIVSKVQTMLEGPLKPVINAFMEHLDSGILPRNFVDTLRNGLGEDLTPNATHALQEYARSLTHDHDAGPFRTGLYLEADGVTNGIVTALHLFTTGQFTGDQLVNFGKGGFLPKGEGMPETMNDLRSGSKGKQDDDDLYKSGSNKQKSLISELYRTRDPKDPIRQQMSHLFNVMSTLLGKDFDFHDDQGQGEIDVDRGIIKNPMQITFYGSGAKGIAGNLADALLEKLYKRMSNVAADPNKDPSQLFDGDKAMTEAFVGQLHTLMTRVVTRDGDTTVVKPSGGKGLVDVDPSKFTVKGKDYDALRDNLQRLFVDPMQTAISQTLGKSVMESKDLIQKVTQAQSVAMQHLFQERFEALKKENGGFVPSENQLNGAIKELQEISPAIETFDQRFFPAKSAKATDNEHVGASLNDTLRTNADYYGPSDVGVGGLAMVTQGMGDGRMMQGAINAGVKGLPVFDGHNSSLETVKANSELLNKAVYQTHQGNSLQALKDSYSTFMDHVRDGLFEDHPGLAEAMIKDLFNEKEANGMTGSDLKPYLEAHESLLSDAAKSVDDRHAAINKYAFGTDHMAGAQSPYEHLGKLLPTDPDLAAAELNKDLNAGQKTVDTSLAREYDLSQQNANYFIGSMKLLSQQSGLFNRIIASKVLDGYRVVSGSLTQVEAYRSNLGLGMPEKASDKTKGFIDYKNQIIHLVSPTGETFLHEAIHAATFKQVLAHYEGETLQPHVHEAVGRLESLMNDFLSLDPKDRPGSFYDASQAVRSALNQDTPEGKAQAVNEFMAWTLANKDLAKIAKGAKASPLALLAQGVWQAIKKLVFGRYAPKVGDDIYSNLVFNTSLLVREQPSVSDVNQEVSSFQNASYGQDDRLSDILGKFDTAIGRFVGPDDPRQEINNKSRFEDTLAHSEEVSTLAHTNGFNLTPQAVSVLQRVVQVMDVSKKLNSNSLSKMEELYRHVSNTLTPKMLEDPAEPNKTWAKHVAEEQYNMLIGAAGMKFDKEGRSSLLPVFTGLALTDENLRRALRNLPLPEGANKNQDGTVDAMIGNVLNYSVDLLGSTLAKQGNARNVGEAMDALTRSVADSSIETANIKDLLVGSPTKAMNWANDIVVNFNEKLADAAIAATKNITDDPNRGNVTKTIAEVTSLMAHLVSEKHADHAGEAFLASASKVKGWQYLKDAVGDLVGRTNVNGNVLDLIKLGHSMVSQTRQQFRENLPKTINEQFSRKLSDAEQTSLHTMAKADVGALMTRRTNDETLNLIDKRSVRDQAIKELEGTLRNQDAEHFEAVKTKSDQLANHMVTGEFGNNLLANSDAISDLLGEKTLAGRQTPSKEYRNAVDQLTTLYALNKLDPGVQKNLSSLVQSENKGMNFLTSYLSGLRKSEVEKTDGMSRYNALKGYIPSERMDGSELRIASDTNASDLLAQSFVRVGDYKGSRLDTDKGSMGYWASPVSMRATFNQGIVQNVVHTAGGVDRATGFTDKAVTGGRITNPGQVASIAKRLSQEGSTKEPLKPIYNEDGKLVAFERTADPDRIRMFNLDTNVSRMTGVWAGRQVEEGMSQQFNTQVIDKLKSMFDTDGVNGNYVNLWDDKVQDSDPVLKDAVRLMTRETRDYIKDTFGSKFMVRSDMIRDLGYRSASIGDAWSGITRWKPETQQAVVKMAIGFLGNDAYRTLVQAEQNWQSVMKDAKSFIVIRSMIVPANNFVANMYQLLLRGVTPLDVIKGIPRKITEANFYTEGRAKEMLAQGKLKVAEGAHDLPSQVRIKAEIQSIQDSWKRLSIWPLIKVGEFGAISNSHVTTEDLMLTGGRIDKYLAQAINQLPKSTQTAARYALVTPDTALYKAMEKAIGYGDFLGKAIYYEHLMQRKGLDEHTAMGKMSEEYVNFDRLPGRDRGYLDSMGVQWFFNHKLRSAKIAMAIIRENPLQALLSAQLGHFQPDTPIQANILGKLWEGKMGYAIGPGMAFKAPTLNPLYQAIGLL